ncbi:MAG: hypothetical protein LBQ79_02745 [Deltaproteobacteria bacterium]|jgi:hypothetical protein|nr:hypothetical protein [Deltaproteobacteria bacterium]
MLTVCPHCGESSVVDPEVSCRDVVCASCGKSFAAGEPAERSGAGERRPDGELSPELASSRNLEPSAEAASSLDQAPSPDRVPGHGNLPPLLPVRAGSRMPSPFVALTAATALAVLIFGIVELVEIVDTSRRLRLRLALYLLLMLLVVFDFLYFSFIAVRRLWEFRPTGPSPGYGVPFPPAPAGTARAGADFREALEDGGHEGVAEAPCGLPEAPGPPPPKAGPMGVPPLFLGVTFASAAVVTGLLVFFLVRFSSLARATQTLNVVLLCLIFLLSLFYIFYFCCSAMRELRATRLEFSDRDRR